MNAFLFSYSPDLGTADEVLAWLDKRIEVARWITPPMPSSVILLSENDPIQLGEIIRNDFPNKYFLLAQLSLKTYSGCLPRILWAEIARALIDPAVWQSLFGPKGLFEKYDKPTLK